MVLVANNDLIVYTDDATDPYTNSNGSSMLTENQSNLDTTIGTLNYDIGHVFSTGGGGTASLQSPCNTDRKARGVTGRESPMNDAFDVDYVAHEMGHQFGANHTFNGTVSSCSGNRSAGAAYEPGSGITIMAYAGICGNQNLARKGIDTFHVRSLEEIVAFITNGTGGSCSANIATSNTAPTVSVSAAGTFNIPKQTPFALDADATDPNGDSITYDWQEYNLGAEAATVPNTDSDGTVRPIFRSYLPQTNGQRFFPSLQYILNNANVPPSTYACSVFTCLTGELLPAITRTMNFQVIARDNRSGGGGISTATVQILVDGDSGPFNVTSPNANTNFTGGSSQIVTWSVNNTNIAPVNAANVKISFSIDGGQTFPIDLAAATPNDGSQSVTLPNINTASARIKIEALGNIFFDISDTNFAVTLQPTVANVSVSGRVVTAQNRGIRNVLVTMSDVNGVQRTATTNSNGYFRFSGVETNANYSFNARSKNYSFTESAQVHNITEETDDIKFVSVGRR